MKILQLAKGRESSLLRRHPWIFSGAIQRVQGKPEAGETVQICDSSGEPLAVGAYSPHSQIRARVWSFKADQQVDEVFLRNRLQQALSRRLQLLSEGAESRRRTACRLVYGESDGLPGLIVDRYDEYLVCQFLAVGVERHKETLVRHLGELFPCKGIYERSDVNVRAREGLPRVSGLLAGEEPPEEILINEQDALYGVDVRNGHKTGFYLDQYHNRQVLRSLAEGKRVLNCFSYTGAFAVAALQGGASEVVNVDSSAPALELAQKNVLRNGFSATAASYECASVFDVLRQYRAEQRSFDLLVLDPPKFAETKVQFKKAARAYKDIALQAAHLLSPGGLLVTFSCSGAIDLPLFQKITADAVLDAGREGQIVRYLHQSEDHPIGLPFPESLYLKGLICRLD